MIGELLVGLVALSGDEDDVARLGECDRARDRLGTVRHRFEIAGAKTFFDVGDDGERIFFARIVGSDDAVVGVLVGDPAHQRAFLFVTIAARAEDDDEAVRSELAQGLQHAEEGIVGVRVIDENLELAFRRDGLETAGHLRRLWRG